MNRQSNWNYAVENNTLSFFYAQGTSDIFAEKEFHTFHEVLYMYDIDATLITERDDVDIKPGDLVIIPKETFHQFILRSPETYWRSCFHFTSAEGLGELMDACTEDIRIINSPDISKLMEQIPKALDESFSKSEKNIYVTALFAQMLLEVKKNLKNSIILKSRDRDSLIYKALNYINQNYRSYIDIDSIADALSVSRSTLSHRFKEELNISVRKYILRKRMVYAHRLLRSGMLATDACKKCGYTDYVAFYRAYKRFYGIAPVDTKSTQQN